MKIAVPITLVPDLVEELVIDESGKALDLTWARMMLNEFDDHALEQAILLKESLGWDVTVLVFDSQDSDEVLYTASAKGADQLIKLTSEYDDTLDNHARARAFSGVLKTLNPDLVLIGVQAHDDLDGQIGPLLAEHLEFPYVGCIAQVGMENDRLMARKEYPGGLLAEMLVALPAVIGIQAANQPPRYVAFSKVQQAMKTAQIDENELPSISSNEPILINRMYPPRPAERAVMIEGDVAEISSQLIEIIKTAV